MHYLRKSKTPLNVINSSLIDLPAMSNLSNMWNFGSMLGVMLMSQISTGIFLAMHYSSNINISFLMLSHLNHDVNYGWFMRLLHCNGASLFFFLIFMHISRSLYFNSFNLKETWISGIMILFISMATAFLGYVLPWGQMSFWGATVITNLMSALPLFGKDLVIWMWGGFSVGNSTLTRFFSFHYMMPFFLIGLIFLHLIYLHENKSSNPMGINKSTDKVPFSPYFQNKDMMSMIVMMLIFNFINFHFPFNLMDSENFNMANPLTTPTHIQPEWYFLFAYAILRAIPNKLGGVIALIMSITLLFLLSLKNSTMQYKNMSNKIIVFWMFCMNFLILTWMGMKPVEQPFIMITQIFSFWYFICIFFWMILYFVSKIVLKTI